MATSVELFSGCGGLALGLSRAGFKHEMLVEFNECAVETVKHNQRAGVEFVRHWPITLADVRSVDWNSLGNVELVAGGPPCQPFSVGGKARGALDSRDMWPEAARAVAELKPKAFLFENVRGLTRPRFKAYFDAVLKELARPSDDLNYRISAQVVNAADFGAAQKRHRVLVFGLLGMSSDAIGSLKPTHSRERLLWDQWVTGSYWADHCIDKNLDNVPKSDAPLVRRLRAADVQPSTMRWVTVRDRLKGLGEPNDIRNHCYQAGAKVYPGHTGSPLDLPAKALKAGDHGVPGGENMMVRDDGTVRYFTLRESARLQGLPDNFEFPRSWTESMRQLGNAVPVELSETAARFMMKLISRDTKDFAIAA